MDARIRPGDQITLRIDREPEMGGTFTVPEDGSVLFPRIGRVQVTEFTPRVLQDTLLRAYGVYLRNPSLETTVLRRVGVQGEVYRPDIYMVDVSVTLRDLIAKAGGVTHAGDPNNISIIREGDRIRIGSDALARFRTSELRSGDQVVIGRRRWYAQNPSVAIGTVTGLISFVITTVLLLK